MVRCEQDPDQNRRAFRYPESSDGEENDDDDALDGVEEGDPIVDIVEQEEREHEALMVRLRAENEEYVVLLAI